MRIALIILLSAVLVAIVIGFVRFLTGADTSISVPNIEGPKAQGGVYRSTDGGAGFTQFALSEGDVDLSKVDIVVLQEDPVLDGTWWLATLGAGLFVWEEESSETRNMESDAGSSGEEGSSDSENDEADEEKRREAWLPVWGQEEVLKGISVRAFARVADAGVLIALDSDNRGRVWKSEDAAASFRETYSAADEKVYVTALTVSPSNPSHVVAGLSDGLLIASHDGGETWASETIFDDAITSLTFAAASDNVLFGSLVKKGAIKSVDGGETWEELSRIRLQRDDPQRDAALSKFSGSRSVFGVILHPIDAAQLLLATAGGLLRSYDSGVHWELLPVPLRPEALPVRAAAYDPRNPTIIHTTAGDGLYTSFDGGANWRVTRFTISPALSRIAVSRQTSDLVLIGTTKK